jgi:hypothetical protein
VYGVKIAYSTVESQIAYPMQSGITTWQGPTTLMIRNPRCQTYSPSTMHPQFETCTNHLQLWVLNPVQTANQQSVVFLKRQ